MDVSKRQDWEKVMEHFRLSGMLKYKVVKNESIALELSLKRLGGLSSYHWRRAIPI